MDLILLILVPVLTVAALMTAGSKAQARMIAAAGTGIQLILSVYLLIMYLIERSSGNIDQMLFTDKYVWFNTLNIYFSTGVDGISVSLILLTAIVTFTGVLALLKEVW